MARFKVLETSYIDGRLVQPGETISYDGHHGPNLQPLDPVKPGLPKGALDLIALARQRAASRGDSPDNAGESDIDSVLADGFKTSDKMVEAAKKALTSASAIA